MKMAKASEADMKMALDLSSALEALTQRWGATVPDAIARPPSEEEGERFDIDDAEQCKRVLEHLLDLARSASLFRVTFGMTVLLDPRNEIVDPDADCLELHPKHKHLKGWLPIETAPDDMSECVVVRWLDSDEQEHRDFDYKEDGCWMKWHDRAEHVEMIGGHGVSYTPPYTHYMPLPPLPTQQGEGNG